MKKDILILNLFLTVFFLNISHLKAQHGPEDYIDTIMVIPVHPTGSDTVRVICYSSFLHSGCGIYKSSIRRSTDSTIDITTLQAVGKDSIPCKSIDTITIGRLKAGIYTLKYILSASGIPEDFDWRIFKFTVLQSTSIASNAGVIERISVYPNPSSDDIKINLVLSKPTNLTVTITDLAGKQLLQKAFPVKQLETTLLLNQKEIPAGTYLINVFEGDKKLASEKFIKIK
jgi:hypothetical protein